MYYYIPVFTIIFLPSFFSPKKKRKSEEGDAPPPSRRWCGGAKRPRRRVDVFFERRREQQQRRTGKEEGVRARPASREKTTDDDVREGNHLNCRRESALGIATRKMRTTRFERGRGGRGTCGPRTIHRGRYRRRRRENTAKKTPDSFCSPRSRFIS